MSKCTIHTINQRIQEKFPNLEYEIIEFITQTYFKTVREGIDELKNIEVTMLFGEFKISPFRIEKRTIPIKKVIQDFENGLKIRNPEKIDHIRSLLVRLEELSQRRTEHLNKRGKVIERTGKKHKRPKKNHIIDAIEKEIELKKELKNNK